MSLLYDADGDRAESINPVVMPGTAGAFAMWVYLTNDVRRQRLWSMAGVDASLSWRPDLGGGLNLSGYRQGSTYGEADANIVDFAAYALNKWLYILFAWDAGTSKLYMGDETSAPAEPSAYSVTTLIASPTGTGGAVTIGNDLANTTRWMSGRVGSWELYNTTPNLAQADLCRLGTYPAQHYLSFGRNGTTNIPDITGNGLTASITGLSSPDINPGPPNGGRSWYHRAHQ